MRLLALYQTMARIRAFENAAEIASQGGVQAWGMEAATTPALVRGPLHLSTGQEAVPTGVCANLTRADLLTSTHRGHGHTLHDIVQLREGAKSYERLPDLVVWPSKSYLPHLAPYSTNYKTFYRPYTKHFCFA